MQEINYLHIVKPIQICDDSDWMRNYGEIKFRERRPAMGMLCSPSKSSIVWCIALLHDDGSNTFSYPGSTIWAQVKAMSKPRTCVTGIPSWRVIIIDSFFCPRAVPTNPQLSLTQSSFHSCCVRGFTTEVIPVGKIGYKSCKRYFIIGIITITVQLFAHCAAIPSFL